MSETATPPLHWRWYCRRAGVMGIALHYAMPPGVCRVCLGANGCGLTWLQSKCPHWTVCWACEGRGR